MFKGGSQKMKSTLYGEFYKLVHKKITCFAPFLILISMIAMGLATGKTQPKLLVMTCFASSEPILLTLVIVASSTFSMEFQNNAILTLQYKSPSKLAIYLSKLLVITIYNLILHCLTMIITGILAVSPIIKPISWTAIYQHQQSLIVNMLSTTGIDLITSTFIISLIFLTSILVNSNALVVTLNIIIIFIGTYASSSLLLIGYRLSRVLRWNPLNMINLTQQYYNAAMIQVTKLSISQLSLATILYFLLFFIIGYLIFRKKRF